MKTPSTPDRNETAAQAAHTPTPWKSNATQIHSENGLGIAQFGFNTGRAQGIIDAQFTTAAVNAHAGLVSENQELKDRLAGYKESAQGWNANFCALNQQHKTNQAENVARIAELEAALELCETRLNVAAKQSGTRPATRAEFVGAAEIARAALALSAQGGAK